MEPVELVPGLATGPAGVGQRVVPGLAVGVPHHVCDRDAPSDEDRARQLGSSDSDQRRAIARELLERVLATGHPLPFTSTCRSSSWRRSSCLASFGLVGQHSGHPPSEPGTPYSDPGDMGATPVGPLGYGLTIAFLGPGCVPLGRPRQAPWRSTLSVLVTLREHADAEPHAHEGGAIPAGGGLLILECCVPDPSLEVPSSSSPRPLALLVASTLCWLCASLLSLAGIALLAVGLREASQADIPGYALFGVLLTVFAVLVLAVAYGVAGYLVRKGRRLGGWIAVLIAGLLSAWSITTLNLLIVIPNLPIVALLVLNWRHLRTGREVGAVARPRGVD